MTIKKILGETGPQSEPCNGGSCPAAVIADDGNVYVQGYVLGEATASVLTAPVGEAFVSIPLPVLKRIAAQVADE